MTVGRAIGGILFFTAIAAAIFWAKHSSAMPNDLLGLTIGMNKAEAQRLLQKKAQFNRQERKNQEVWTLDSDPFFYAVAIGYDAENKIRYISAFVDKDRAKEHITFANVGSFLTARSEITEPHHRYIWDVAATDKIPAYKLNVYGDNPDYVTIYSLVRNDDDGSKVVDNDDDRD